MNKINFEDATLVTQAKVTVGGTDYEVTPATYSGGTDLDADTLNYAFQLMHPVGSIYMSVDSTNPAQVFGFGTWVAWGAGRVPVGVDTSQTEFDTVEETGGSKALQEHTHNLIIANIYYQTGATNVIVPTNPPAAGSVETSTAGTGNSGNLQPYITCYMWKRTA